MPCRLASCFSRTLPIEVSARLKRALRMVLLKLRNAVSEAEVAAKGDPDDLA